ncbi:unnamed protein product [Rotaria magnacalcarata]|uniref:FLYWCH-type domain-containing protein n=1 Tax=Rotaria magnacalcarata TaxID=392030 RepID=A0A815TEA0_9BILA|nr:unnamed protein product [Rotaria magnacalcarata]
MPVTTRAAALLLHAVVEQSISEQQLHEQQTKSLMPVEYDRYHDSKHSISDTDLSIANLFAPLSLTVTKTYEVKTSEQSNQQSALHHTQSCRSMSPTSPLCSAPIALLVSGKSSSDENQNDSSFGYANAMLNVPIDDGDITTGTSQRGGRMIFLNGYSYLYMSESKATFAWQCSKRVEHCKAVIHTSKVTTQNHRLYTRVVQPHSNLWFFLQCLKQEESMIFHRMVQTGIGFSAAKAHKSTRAAARKSKQIVKLLNLLASNQRSLVETISLFTYIVGGPVGRELLQHDHIIFERVLSECPPNFYYLPHEHSPIGESEVDIRQCTTWTLANNWRESYWRSSAIPNKYYK